MVNNGLIKKENIAIIYSVQTIQKIQFMEVNHFG